MLDSNQNLAQEWRLLQNQYDSYEKYSLIIKLVSVMLCAVATLFGSGNAELVFLLVVLWIQDAVWKTFQSRIEHRLLAIEAAFRNDNEIEALQFNSAFLETRPGAAGLCLEYFSQCVRPTMIFPHVILVIYQLFTTFI